ncbi:MAG TPA: extracellular solute-binding protein [Chloroflexota bacterium]|nr:extracellular solute-binding protein [Chloroflexota bacterium]
MSSPRSVAAPARAARRRVLGASVMGLPIGLLAACAQDGTAPAASTARQTASLAFLLEASAESLRVNEAAATVYAQQHPNVKVALEPFSGGAEAYEEKITTLYAAGTAPDLFTTHDSNTSKYIERNLVARAPKDVDAYVRKEALNEGVLQACSDAKRVVYAAPWVSDWVALYYNTEHFVEAGLDPKRPPKTIDEFADHARRLTKSDGAKLARSGFYVRRTGLGSGILEKFFPFFAAFGGKLYKPDLSAIAWNSEAGVKALTWYGDLVQRLRVDSDDVPADTAAFRAQQTAMYHRETPSIAAFQRTNPELKFATAPMPRGAAESDTVANIDGLVVTVQSKAPDEAWRLVAYYVSPAVDLQRTRELALTPSYKVTANDPFVKSSPYYPAWLQQATHPLPGHPRISEVNTVLGNLVAQVCLGRIGARDAITQGEREGTAALLLPR